MITTTILKLIGLAKLHQFRGRGGEKNVSDYAATPVHTVYPNTDALAPLPCIDESVDLLYFLGHIIVDLTLNVRNA